LELLWRSDIFCFSFYVNRIETIFFRIHYLLESIFNAYFNFRNLF
jgi:hypothetical protein